MNYANYSFILSFFCCTIYSLFCYIFSIHSINISSDFLSINSLVTPTELGLSGKINDAKYIEDKNNVQNKMLEIPYGNHIPHTVADPPSSIVNNTDTSDSPYPSPSTSPKPFYSPNHSPMTQRRSSRENANIFGSATNWLKSLRLHKYEDKFKDYTFEKVNHFFHFSWRWLSSNKYKMIFSRPWLYRARAPKINLVFKNVRRVIYMRSWRPQESPKRYIVMYMNSQWFEVTAVPSVCLPFLERYRVNIWSPKNPESPDIHLSFLESCIVT